MFPFRRYRRAARFNARAVPLNAAVGKRVATAVANPPEHDAVRPKIFAGRRDRHIHGLCLLEVVGLWLPMLTVRG